MSRAARRSTSSAAPPTTSRPCATRSRDVSARRPRRSSPGARRARHRSRAILRRRSSACWRRWRTATTCRPSTPISRYPTPISRASARDADPIMLILGLDPGLRHTGWGVITTSGNRLSHVADGVVHSDGKDDLASRLVTLYRQVGTVIDRYRPEVAAVEETFVNKNAASTLKLGLARGVALLAPAERGIPVAEYSTNLVKKSVVGAGHAEKAQVQMMVRRLLPGCTLASADAADALAVAICHAHHAGTMAAWSVMR